MVTGDHPLTAEAIGRKINLMVSDTKERLSKRTGRPIDAIKEDEYFAIVIHGEKIDSLSESDWDTIFSKDEIIFARTSPKHKLTIVKRAQAIGHIVGVTGDGVNDSPALKKADLGIAMNQSGSDVSKEAAAMILLDDNFASIVQGIAEGISSLIVLCLTFYFLFNFFSIIISLFIRAHSCCALIHTHRKTNLQQPKEIRAIRIDTHRPRSRAVLVIRRDTDPTRHKPAPNHSRRFRL